MLTPRLAIIAAVLLLAVSVVASVVGTLSPDDTGGAAADSYGVGREGNRGLFDLLSELRIPVRRQVEPYVALPPPDAALVMLAPDPLLVRTEPLPLRKIVNWVAAGGRLIIAPDFPTQSEEEQLQQLAKELAHFDQDVLPALDLGDVRVELMLSSDVPEESPPDDSELVISTVAARTDHPATQIEQLFTLGSALPEVLWDADRPPVWQTRILDAKGEERVLAAAFEHGQGEIVVVSDATLCANSTLGRGQNAAWWLGLLLDRDRREVVLDEFYHGRSIRGNAWWLLTKPAFAALAIAGLLLVGLWTWRHGVLLGPPLADHSLSRRSIGEYIEAMGRFFLRGRDADRFTLEQLRAGVWRRLTAEVGLPAASTDVDLLVSRLERRDPEWAGRARRALAFSEAALRQSGRRATAERLRAMQMLSEAASGRGGQDE